MFLKTKALCDSTSPAWSLGSGDQDCRRRRVSENASWAQVNIANSLRRSAVLLDNVPRKPLPGPAHFLLRIFKLCPNTHVQLAHSQFPHTRTPTGTLVSVIGWISRHRRAHASVYHTQPNPSLLLCDRHAHFSSKEEHIRCAPRCPLARDLWSCGRSCRIRLQPHTVAPLRIPTPSPFAFPSLFLCTK
jgi:hypothetical protein